MSMMAFTVEQFEREADVAADRYADPHMAHMLRTAAAFARALGVGVLHGGRVQARADLVSISDAARIVGVTRQLIHTAIREGVVRVTRTVGDVPRVDLVDVWPLQARTRRGACAVAG
jgi:hypothetical protein